MQGDTPVEQDNVKGQSECRQCGACCRKGGPALHLEDLPLVTSGKIPLKMLFTIRQGEPAFDNVRNAISPAVTDIVKIKGGPSRTSVCCLYDFHSKHCGQYDDRPAECRALKCWDVAEIQELYNCRRLTRRNVLSKIDGLWQLVSDHQEKCDYGHVADLAGQVRKNPDNVAAREELLEMIRFDDSLRRLTVERMNVEPAMNDFFFGRPLSFTIQMFKLRYMKESQSLKVDGTSEVQADVCYRRNGFPTPPDTRG